jgi:hypothetical protein
MRKIRANVFFPPCPWVQARGPVSDDYQKRVIVVDSSNEIGGEGDIPHPAIGSARRMQVPQPEKQHAVMIEAVENHMPEVIIIDEIGTSAEAMVARTIAERGVQLIGSAHGTTMENLLMNPTLSDLIGGVHTVTLSDEEARRRRSPKTINERKTSLTFDILIEIVNPEKVTIHRNVAEAVDLLLRGVDPHGEHRQRDGQGRTQIEELPESAITSPLTVQRVRIREVRLPQREEPPSRGPGKSAHPPG